MAASPVNTIQDYFNARVPDLAKFLPGFKYQVAEAAAMAFYWRRLFPVELEPFTLNETRLSELQKTIVALKIVVSAVPQMLAAASAGASIAKVTSGPDSFQYEERVKYYNSMMSAWQNELSGMESSLGLSSNVAVKPPSFRMVVN